MATKDEVIRQTCLAECFDKPFGDADVSALAPQLLQAHDVGISLQDLGDDLVATRLPVRLK